MRNGKHGTINTDRKRNNRTHALERFILADLYEKPLSSRQRKRLARVAYARNLRLGTTRGMKLAKNRKLDNTHFKTVSKLKLGTHLQEVAIERELY